MVYIIYNFVFNFKPGLLKKKNPPLTKQMARKVKRYYIFWLIGTKDIFYC